MMRSVAEAFNQPEDKSIKWARDREGMKQRKPRRIEAEADQKAERVDR